LIRRFKFEVSNKQKISKGQLGKGPKGNSQIINNTQKKKKKKKKIEGESEQAK
jgi:hypothetical protein